MAHTDTQLDLRGLREWLHIDELGPDDMREWASMLRELWLDAAAHLDGLASRVTWEAVASWVIIIVAVAVTAFLLARWVDYLCDDDLGDQ